MMKNFDEFYESLWANIHKKRQRIKQGSGEKMRKVGDKGAPTRAQMSRAKSEDAHTPVDRVKDAHTREKQQDKNRRDRELDRARLQTARQKNTQTTVENAPSLAVLKKKIKSGTKLGSTETSSAKARGLIPRADGTKKKSPKYK
jgi:hypothetical protein|tara:strand:- start:166 stop:597 length:432 start_codon:yes stop_codon:yes gene_type:complete